MPELPEVETVRRGLDPIIAGRTVREVLVRNDRTVRRQMGGRDGFRDRVEGRRLASVQRRGKYLWVSDGSDEWVLVAHLGMSGQFRALAPGDPPGRHERVRFVLDDGSALAFQDQRTFGWLLVDDCTDGVPACVGHIAVDPFDGSFDLHRAARRLISRRTAVKRALLDQTVVSGIGNIYADETLWRERLHPLRAADALRPAAARRLLSTARDVMAEALAAGGTSFDALYVDVNGESGWFARDLAVYGREGQPCRRCGRAIVREAFTNRSSYRCPACQRAPRAVR